MPCFAAISLSVVEQIDGAKFRTVDETGVPDSNPISTSSALSGAFSGETTHCHIAFVRRVGRIFELAAFVAEVPDVAIAAVDVFLALLDGTLCFCA